jgi:hypothetical protein
LQLKMKEHTFNRTVGDFSGAPQPNFDDERTLQSARPVVPLEKINAKLRHRRQWFLGGAFALAMLLGAASALVASYLKMRTAPVSISEVSEVDVVAAPVAAAEPLPSESPMVEDTEEPPPTPVSEEKEVSSSRRRTEARRIPELAQPRSGPRVSEEEELERIRGAVLYDQWQERRARRAMRRERRNQIERYNHRDLSNLDEIFEGRRRPNP